ncbi:MAG TPA: DedA family protein [Balneolaceae bacterium]|nr:DedA family protein [Balneolaceae bacterium]
MEWLKSLIDFILHIDDHLQVMIAHYGNWTYGILFLIIFAETGLVVTPFLPGDSLIFAAGALSADGPLNPLIIFLLLTAAAILGDTINYWAGSYMGIRIFKKDAKVLKLEYLERTENFFAKYGGKTIFVARFVPIVRTYAPFVAGASTMDYPRFLFYNVVGAITWVGLFTFGGYFFGNLPFVKKNFGLVVIVIILLSVVPVLTEFWRNRRVIREAD